MCSSAVEEEREWDLDCDFELRFEVFPLRFGIAVGETIVIETYLAEGYNVGRGREG